MSIRTIIGSVSAFALTSIPALAQAVERAAEPVQGQSELFGGSTLLTILVIVALGVGIFLLVDDDDSDSP